MIGSSCTPSPVMKKDAALTLARRNVIGAGFALPRDAGRRPAQFSRWGLQAVPALLHNRRYAVSRPSGPMVETR